MVILVAVDAAALCLRSANSVLLRGSSSALHSNEALVTLMRRVLREQEFPEDAVVMVPNPTREELLDMLQLRGTLDAIVPRGGAGLIDHVVAHSKVPVLETGAGVCHTYLAATAPYEYAEAIVINAKVQRPSVCNACETLLIDKKWSEDKILSLFQALAEKEVTLRLDDALSAIAKTAGISFEHATEDDWSAEYLDLTLACKQVSGVVEAIEHIHRYGTAHSECIVSADNAEASRFLAGVDAAAVYHNASTRFTDGFEFGFGAEIGISNQKLHARGPMGLRELTTYKYLLRGEGTIR